MSKTNQEIAKRCDWFAYALVDGMSSINANTFTVKLTLIRDFPGMLSVTDYVLILQAK